MFLAFKAVTCHSSLIGVDLDHDNLNTVTKLSLVSNLGILTARAGEAEILPLNNLLLLVDDVLF